MGCIRWAVVNVLWIWRMRVDGGEKEGSDARRNDRCSGRLWYFARAGYPRAASV